jgi:hypothetical protein
METKLYDCLPAQWGGEDSAASALPFDRVNLAQWIAEQEERLRQLRERERLFKATGDLKYLEEFRFRGTFPAVKLEKKINGPVAIFDMDGYLAKENAKGLPGEKWIKEQNEIAKEFFPEITIREVKTRSGERRLAYIGVTTEMLYAAIEARIAEKKLQSKIELAKSREAVTPRTLKDRTAKITTLPGKSR